VAVLLAKEWNLPRELAIPMTHAHCPDDAPDDLRTQCQLLGLARTVGRVLTPGVDRGTALQQARDRLASCLNFTSERTDELLDTLGERVQQTARMMGFRVGKQPTLDDILQEANRSLIDMNLSYEDLVSKLEQTIAEKQKLAEELDKRNQELERLSRTDALTQLPNRRVLFETAHTEVLRSARGGEPVSMVVGDIDFFKQFNDRFGHVFGDVVLKAVAEALADSVRAVDVAARAGGEEFALLLPNTALSDARVVAERARRKVEAIRLTAPTGDPAAVTMSFGVAEVRGPFREPRDVEAVVTRLYQTADEALYEAKEEGRNQVCLGAEVPWIAPSAPRVAV
jgi:diguanylate cyclase (GGDEF)-like protein